MVRAPPVEGATSHFGGCSLWDLHLGVLTNGFCPQEWPNHNLISLGVVPSYLHIMMMWEEEGLKFTFCTVS